MTFFDGKTLRQRMIQILTANPEHIAIIQLFQFQAQTTDENQIQIRQTILLVLENHHDWNKITKCLHFWKGLDRYIKSFYKRMKQRLHQPCDINIPISDMEADFQRMFDKHSQMIHNKAEPLNVDIDRFLTKDYKKNPSVVVENNLIVNNHNVDQKNEDSNTVKSQMIMKEIPKIAQPQNDNISEKSNSMSSKSSNVSNVRMIEKKPTFGMLRRQEGNSNSSSNSNLVNRRNTSRRTFGQGNELKSVQVQNKLQSLKVEQKQESNNTKIQPPNKDDLVDLNKQPQKPPQQQLQTQQPKRSRQQQLQPRKLNIFQRKQQTMPNNSNRSNAHFATNQSIGNNIISSQPQQLLQPKSKQKRLQNSMSKSVTPHKPLAHRKKIILKKPSDFQHNFFDSDDEFSSFKKFDSHDQSYDVQFQSDDNNSFPIMNSEELQLRSELQNQFNSNSLSFDNGPSADIEMKMVSKQRQRNAFNPEKKEEKLVQSKQKIGQYKQNTIQTSMVRQPDQLFSDYEVSLMGFNPRQYECENTYYTLMDKCKTWSWKGECNKWDEKIQRMKEKKKQRQNNIK